MSACKICDQALVLEVDPEEYEEASSSAAAAPSTVPDDLELQCHCHFHWQCFMDESSDIVNTCQCPSCSARIKDNATQQIMAHHTNEGGSTTLNMLPLVQEEAYLTSNPSARPARAFLTMCAEGDVGGAVDLLQTLSQDDDDDDDDDEPSMSPVDILQYQDPLTDNKSALHIAVVASQIEVIWLLLWLASAVPNGSFPQQAVNAAMSMGATRAIAEAGLDIRSLMDTNGQTAGQLAEQSGGMVAELVRAGLL